MPEVRDVRDNHGVRLMFTVIGFLYCRDENGGLAAALVSGQGKSPAPFTAETAGGDAGVVGPLDAEVERLTGLPHMSWTHLLTLTEGAAGRSAVVMVADWPTTALSFDYRQSLPVRWAEESSPTWQAADPVVRLIAAALADPEFPRGCAVTGYPAGRLALARFPGSGRVARPVREPDRGEAPGLPTPGTEAGGDRGGAVPPPKPAVRSGWGDDPAALRT